MAGVNATVKLLIADERAAKDAGNYHFGSEPWIKVTDVVNDGACIFPRISRSHPDVLILSDSLPHIAPVADFIRKLHDTHSQVKVLLLSEVGIEEDILEAMVAGASSVVLRGNASWELLEAIRSVHEHGAYLSPSVSKMVIKDYVRVLEGNERVPLLTRKQMEVLKLLSEGLSDDDVAKSLGISNATVRVHRRDIMKRLGVVRRETLIAYGQRVIVEDLEMVGAQ